LWGNKEWNGHKDPGSKSAFLKLVKGNGGRLSDPQGVREGELEERKLEYVEAREGGEKP
jgi:hypothetical protein